MSDKRAEHIKHVLLEKISRDKILRTEALSEFFKISMPGADKIIFQSQTELAKKNGTLSETIPEVPEELYCKWIDEFIQSLVSNLPKDQLDSLVDGSSENNAALALVYIMFMESERMEKQVPEDIKNYFAKAGLSNV